MFEQWLKWWALWGLGLVLALVGVWQTDMFLIGFGTGVVVGNSVYLFAFNKVQTHDTKTNMSHDAFFESMVNAARAMGPMPGLSLRFIRGLVGHPAKYADALSAMHHVPHGKFYPVTPPEPGSIAYYDSRHGNVAYALPGGQVIALDGAGYPVVVGYDERDEHNRPKLGVYKGWSRYLGDQKV